MLYERKLPVKVGDLVLHSAALRYAVLIEKHDCNIFTDDMLVTVIFLGETKTSGVLLSSLERVETHDE